MIDFESEAAASSLVAFKLGILDRALPAESTVVYGDIYRVDGLYSYYASERCPRVLLVDSAETELFQRRRLERPQVDFVKGDFADPRLMDTIHDQFDVGVAFDILLHQATMLGALNLILQKVSGRICIVQPMLRERDVPGVLVYLPGNTRAAELHPMGGDTEDYNIFAADEVDSSRWLWGMTPSFLTSALAGEGFVVEHEEMLSALPNPAWMWWGCIAERRSAPRSHWSAFSRVPGFLRPTW